MQRGVAEIEWPDGGPRPFQRARHGREVAPDQVDHAGAENLSNVGIDVGDFTSRFGFENRRNALLTLHVLIPNSHGAVARMSEAISGNRRDVAPDVASLIRATK